MKTELMSSLQKSWSVVVVLMVLFNVPGFAQQEKHKKDSVYSVIYFGATDCYYCNIEKNISNISKMVTEIKENYKQLNIKTTIVSMDKDIAEGLKFIEKYTTKNWDEIAIGSFYKNELALTYLNKTKIPGVPHLVVIKHVTVDSDLSVPVSISDEVLVDLVGGTEIDGWMKENYSFKK
jgi:hypothetical protein